MPLFSFNGQSNQDPSQAAGMQQYMLQGQMGLNPGQALTQAADPISAAGKIDFGSILKGLAGSGPPGAQPQDPTQVQNTLQQGAMATPNNPSGQNMGGVGPTMQNQQALMNPNYQQQLAAMLQGGGY